MEPAKAVVAGVSATEEPNMPSWALIVDDDAATCELIQWRPSASIDVASLTPHPQRSGRHPSCSAKNSRRIFPRRINMPAPNGHRTNHEKIPLLAASTLLRRSWSSPAKTICALLGRAFEAGANFFLYKPVDCATTFCAWSVPPLTRSSRNAAAFAESKCPATFRSNRAI